MVFDSPVFVFLFLPMILAIYYAIPRKGRNSVLLAAGLLFYAWGDAQALWVLLLSTAANYAIGLGMERAGPGRPGKVVLGLALCGNLALLMFYKYLKFAVDNLGALGMVNPGAFDWTTWHIPLGISFFTFSAMAYHVDIYRGKSRAERSLIDFALFFSHFAKVIAGPIVRYSDVSAELNMRKQSWEGFASGVQRFVIGLGKKVLVANQVAVFADEAFKNPGGLDMPTAWLGVLCYSLQLYFDFSGYSDMAIGLARMFGFTFMENFNYPYISLSIQEFWRRWHISLSLWFRDYLYIPLGGSRVSEARIYFNLVLVFFLCGFWHGASWSFIVWGLFHGVFLVLERIGLGRVLQGTWRPFQHVYALLVIMIGWVFFRAADLTQAILYLRAMFSFSYGAFEYYSMNYVSRQLLAVLIFGIVGSTPILGLASRLGEHIGLKHGGRWQSLYNVNFSAATIVLLVLVFVAAAMQLALTTYTPFIYARF